MKYPTRMLMVIQTLVWQQIYKSEQSLYARKVYLSDFI